VIKVIYDYDTLLPFQYTYNDGRAYGGYDGRGEGWDIDTEGGGAGYGWGVSRLGVFGGTR
jgi:hypothetical protein